MIRGQFVNSDGRTHPAVFAAMADLKTWAHVADRIAGMPRGTKLRLARAIDMDPSFMDRKLKAGGDLTVTHAAKVREFFGDDDDADLTPPAETTRRVPVYGFAAAGGGEGDRIAFNNGEILDWVDLPSGVAPRGDVFIVRILGSSMEPRLFDGESLVVQRNVPPGRERDAVIEFNDGSAVVKTYRGQRDGKLWAFQYNDARELSFDASSVKAVHNVFCRL